MVKKKITIVFSLTLELKFSLSFKNVQSDQNVSLHLTITVNSTGAQILFDHPVCRQSNLWPLDSKKFSSNSINIIISKLCL